MRPARLTRVGVVVPVHDEADHIDTCLRALAAAALACPVPVDMVVVLDDCHDASEEICRSHAVRTLTTDARNVGLVRALGATSVLHGSEDPEALWIASTDADTVVPPTWLTDQVALADGGADLVLGTVDLDGSRLTSALRARFDHGYAHDAIHPHVHGANLGIRGGTYLRAGGFPPLPNHEDHALVTAVLALPEVTVERPSLLRVSTSGRLVGRCTEGFAAHLASLSEAV